MSTIQWTEKTWNPTVGCSIVSAECRECYAMKMAHRLAAMGQEKYRDLTEVVNGKVVWNGIVRLDRNALDIPYSTKKPTLWFVDSMSDLFHETLTHDDICSVWSVMVVCDRHRYQVLTKRTAIMRDFVNGWIGHMRSGSMSPVANVWLGTSIGHRLAKHRIQELRDTNAAVRFLSCEPLLEDLGELNLAGIHWVIVGGESGPKARPCNLAWIRNIVRQCKEQNVKVFVKQLGAVPMEPESDWRGRVLTRVLSAKNAKRVPEYFVPLKYSDKKAGDPAEWPEDLRIREFPAELAGTDV